LKGDDLREADFHTIANICELNMASEEHKFPWHSFARAMVRVSGCRGLARLARWHDREKISLSYTLLPYLATLIDEDRMDPDVAVGLVRLAEPVELHVCGTAELAEILVRKGVAKRKGLLAELILYFRQNHPRVFMPTTVATLAKLAQGELGEDSPESRYLAVASRLFSKLRDEAESVRQHRDAVGWSNLRGGNDSREEESSRVLGRVLENSDPVEEEAFARALEAIDRESVGIRLRKEFFSSMRGKVRYSDRARYVRMVAASDRLGIYEKLEILAECKEDWASSSLSLHPVYREIGRDLVRMHAEDFMSYGYLSEGKLKDIASISEMSVMELVLELIEVSSTPDVHPPASIWIGVAAVVCEAVPEGEGQAALGRLLSSGAAKLTSSVPDGDWREGLYPKSDQIDVAAGLVWLSLGSPSAEERWRAAHAIRCFARMDRWDIVRRLVERFSSDSAHPYQAPELPFFFLHARLWLLIAFSRLAADYPRSVAEYKTLLTSVALPVTGPSHVLMRCFAAKALLRCVEGGVISMSSGEVEVLLGVERSPFPVQVREDHRKESFYLGRPGSMPEPEHEFHLEYDFEKLEVIGLSDLFGRSRWDVKDSISGWAREYDPSAKGMYEDGGRWVSGRRRMYSSTSRDHSYGYQIGWHGLFVVAEALVRRFPAVRWPYDGETPWSDWLRRRMLTRDDGFWLADAVDLAPVEVHVNLCERGDGGPELTGDPSKLLSLLSIGSDGRVGAEVVVAGAWRSEDGVRIYITSALAPARSADRLGRQLAKAEPLRAWLPSAEGATEETEHVQAPRPPFQPLICWHSRELGLDEGDPFAVAEARAHLITTATRCGCRRVQGSRGNSWLCAPSG
jgi:hypothetical protein